MKQSTVDRILDKGIDILVVIVGILIALSIDSYKDQRESERQWLMFAEQFKADAEMFGDSFPKIISFYKQRVSETKKMLEKVNQGSKRVKELDDFIPSMGQIQVDFPTPTLYEALIQSGNANLINDTEKLRILGRFYTFHTIAMAKADLFSEHFSPEYKILLKKYFQNPENIAAIRDELNYTLQMHLHFMEDNLKTYQRQNQVRQEVLDILAN